MLERRVNPVVPPFGDDGTVRRSDDPRTELLNFVFTSFVCLDVDICSLFDINTINSSSLFALQASITKISSLLATSQGRFDAIAPQIDDLRVSLDNSEMDLDHVEGRHKVSVQSLTNASSRLTSKVSSVNEATPSIAGEERGESVRRYRDAQS